MVKILRKIKQFYLKFLPMDCHLKQYILFIMLLVWNQTKTAAQELGEMWGTAEEEEQYYTITNIPIPPGVPMLSLIHI